MEPGTIELFLSGNADLHAVLPVLDETGAGVDMTGWPFKMELKFSELDTVAALTITVTPQAVGELLLTATQANCAALFTGKPTAKLLALGGDLLTRPNNGSYSARLGTVKAVVGKGWSAPL